MKILIDVGHPAHIHLFRNFTRSMAEKGNQILFTCRNRDLMTYLLDYYGFKYVVFGSHYKKTISKIWGLIKYDLMMLSTAIKFNPDLFVSHGSTYSAHTSFALHKPHISFEDTFNMEQVRLCLPFTDVVLTGDYPHKNLGRKELQYSGYHELAYLHPKRFHQDESILNQLGVEKNGKYAIVRFVAWTATHDVGLTGLSYQNKIKLVKELSKYLKVFVSSEGDLPYELTKYKLSIRPEQIHQILFYAHLLVGESATMASECAVLGTPAVYINDSHLGYLLEQQDKYGLVFCYKDSEDQQSEAIEKALELAKNETKREFVKKRDNMLNEKIDVTAFLEWFVKNYPESFKLMKADPDYQKRFK